MSLSAESVCSLPLKMSKRTERKTERKGAKKREQEERLREYERAEKVLAITALQQAVWGPRMPLCVLTLWFHSGVLLLSWEIKTFLFSLQMSVLGAARCAGGRRRRLLSSQTKLRGWARGPPTPAPLLQETQPATSPFTSDPSPLTWGMGRGGGATVKSSENVNSQSPQQSDFSWGVFQALLDQSPTDDADSVRFSVDLHICMHILYVCVWGGLPFLLFWPSPLPEVIETIASAIYSGLLADQEENTINPSGTSRETTG